MRSSTGLPPRTAAALAYVGWWMTGLIFWAIEREDQYVRWHARQAVLVFGTLAAVIAGFCALAVVSLLVLPEAFTWLLGGAAATWAAASVVWGVAIVKAVRGEWWRAPFVARPADPGLARRQDSPGA
jgi:uncharacterized membrane protein